MTGKQHGGHSAHVVTEGRHFFVGQDWSHKINAVKSTALNILPSQPLSNAFGVLAGHTTRRTRRTAASHRNCGL
jgi:hypothetical protein